MAVPVLKRLQNVLTHYGLEAQSNIEICTCSGINEVFFINTDQGKVALKHHIQNNDLARLEQEVELAIQLSENNTPCPKVLTNQAGQMVTEYQSSELYIATEYIEGNYFPQGKDLQLQHIQNAAEALARFHKTSQEQQLHINSRQIPSYDIGALINRLMTYRCQLHTLESTHTSAADLLALLHESMPVAMGLSRLLPDEVLCACEKVIIQGNFQPSKLLVDEQGGLKAFLDLDDARHDLRIYDLYQLALYSVNQGLGQRAGEQRADSWKLCLEAIIEGYQKVTRLAAAELDAFPALCVIHFLHQLADEKLDVSTQLIKAEIQQLEQAHSFINDDMKAIHHAVGELKESVLEPAN